MPKLNEFIFGKKSKNKQLGTKTPEQMELLKLITDGLSTGEGALADIFGGFNQDEFDQGVTQPALKNFQENILPSIMEKFNAGGQVGGSGQQRASNKAGVDLQSKLAELMYQAQNQQKQNKIQGVNTALETQTFENVHKPATQGALQGLINGVGQGVGTAASAAIAG